MTHCDQSTCILSAIMAETFSGKSHMKHSFPFMANSTEAQWRILGVFNMEDGEYLNLIVVSWGPNDTELRRKRQKNILCGVN